MTAFNPEITADDVALAAAAHGIADPLHAADRRLGALVLAELHQDYPGWQWSVSARHEQGVVWVRNLNLASRMGFVLKIAQLTTDADFKRETMTAGGELLERFHQPRGRFDADKYLAWFQAVGARGYYGRAEGA